MIDCVICGPPAHDGPCPQIKSVTYTPDGSVIYELHGETND